MPDVVTVWVAVAVPSKDAVVERLAVAVAVLDLVAVCVDIPVRVPV